MSKVKVGIVGASGLLGGYLTKGFLANGNYTLVLLTRKGSNKANLDAYKDAGATVREYDIAHEASLVAAMQGLEIVISAVAFMANQTQPELIKAAAKAGVRRFVPAEFGADLSLALQAIPELGMVMGGRQAIRDLLEASGMEWTYVSNGWFLETAFTPLLGFDIANGKATVKGNVDVPFALTSCMDIGIWLAIALLDPRSKNTTVCMRGESITYEQALATIEAATGKKLEVTRVTMDELNAHITAAPSPFAVFGELITKAMTSGFGDYPDSRLFPGLPPPQMTLAKYAKLGNWSHQPVA